MDNKEIENLEPVEQTAPNNQFNTSNEVTNVQQQSQIQQQIPQQPNNAVSNVTQNNNAANFLNMIFPLLYSCSLYQKFYQNCYKGHLMCF